MAFEDHLLAADRAVSDRLGRDVIYTPDGGDPVTIRGVFDDAYLAATPGQPGVSTQTPALFLDLTDLEVDPRSDNPSIVIVVRGETRTYEVKEVQPDGSGVGVLLLLSWVS